MMTGNQPRDDVIRTPFPMEQLFWKFGSEPEWSRIEREDNEMRWHRYGPLDEFGKQYLLQHFELSGVADDLPIERLKTMSPPELRMLSRQTQTVAARVA